MAPRAALCRVVSAAAALCACALAGAARVANAHPLHTTLVQITYDERTRTMENSIRVFASDFAAAMAKRKGTTASNDDRVSDADAMAYVSGSFRVTDANGRTVPLAWCGSRRAADVLWLCVRAANVQAPSAVRVSDQMLCELFDDQINIVQATVGARHASVLFTKGDGAKSLL